MRVLGLSSSLCTTEDREEEEVIGDSGLTPVYLNVYDLTPVNNYLYWFGLGIFHSGIEEKAESFERMGMDPQHAGDLLKHLEKQSELLKEAHKTMSQELQNLEVEEHMMRRKLSELLITHRSNKKKEETQIVSKGEEEETRIVLKGKETDRDSGSPSEKPLQVYSRRRRKDRNLVSTDNDA